MTSKIFMGDMPELMENILSNLNEEYYSLRSCVLVSRHWCNMAIPILWRDPFSFEQKPMYISRYFSTLNEYDKFILKECGIIVEFPYTLFHYSKFLKVLDLYQLEKKIHQWIISQSFNSQQHIDSLTWDIANLLFKLFIESGAILSKFNLDISYAYAYLKSEIFYSLGRNEHFFSRLQDLSVGVISEYFIEDANILLGILAKNTTKINTLTYDAFESYFDLKLFHTLVCIIKSQEKLKRIKLIGGEILGTEKLPKEFYSIITAIESQKNSLQEIIIELCTYNEEFKTLLNCEELKIIRILYCDEEEKILKALENGHCKISTIEIASYFLHASNILQILEKSGLLLQRLKLDSNCDKIESQTSLLKTLVNFCPNIIYLNISHIELSDQLLELINNLQKLQFLTLIWSNVGTEEITKERVMKFAKILPITLQYLDLGNIWLNLHINILLDNCDAPLKRLLFSIVYDNDDEYFSYKKTLEAIIRFCMHKKTLNEVCVSTRNRVFSSYTYKFNKYNMTDSSWDKIKKDLKGYVNLVPHDNIIVNC